MSAIIIAGCDGRAKGPGRSGEIGFISKFAEITCQDDKMGSPGDIMDEIP